MPHVMVCVVLCANMCTRGISTTDVDLESHANSAAGARVFISGASIMLHSCACPVLTAVMTHSNCMYICVLMLLRLWLTAFAADLVHTTRRYASAPVYGRIGQPIVDKMMLSGVQWTQFVADSQSGLRCLINIECALTKLNYTLSNKTSKSMKLQTQPSPEVFLRRVELLLFIIWISLAFRCSCLRRFSVLRTLSGLCLRLFCSPSKPV